jgi:RNA polymerase primary sigma factor
LATDEVELDEEEIELEAVEDIVAEAVEAVDLTVVEEEHKEDPVTESIQLPADALVLSDDDDDIPVQNLTISGATADPVKDYL